MSTSVDFSCMSVEELGMWLQQQGIPSEFCEKFEGAYLLLPSRRVPVTV